MQRLVTAGLSALILAAAIAPVAQAQQRRTPVSPTPVRPMETMQDQTPTQARMEMAARAGGVLAGRVRPDITPFALAQAARQGLFERQGIPSHETLASRYLEGSIGAEEIVEAAIISNRLPADMREDRVYLDIVDAVLNDFLEERRN